MKTDSHSTVLAFSLASCLALVGCSSGPKTDFQTHPTSEFHTVSATPAQIADDHRRMLDLNERQLHEDWIRLWLLDRPRRLNIAPIR